MTLPFNEKIVNDGNITPDNFKYPNFVGYLNPSGVPIDYSMPFGLGGHDNNPTTDYFMEYYIIRTKPYINYDKSKFIPLNYYRKYQSQKENNYRQAIEENNDIHLCELRRERINNRLASLNKTINFRKKHNYNNHFCIMDRDIMQFIANCYSNESFNKGLGKDIRFMGEAEFYDKYFCFLKEERDKRYPREKSETDIEYSNRTSPWYNFDYQYNRYIKTALLDVLKEVFICYLGYHSVERVPRTITTSEFNIYETFYNYLLNDFNIIQIPKMIYDPDKKIYVEQKQNQFFMPDSEMRLKEEIQSIKKLVHRNERYKYYR